MLTLKQQSGRLLELTVAKFMQKNNVEYSHNRFNDSEYPLGEGKRPDGLITQNGELKVLIECTNPKASTWMTDDIMQKKLGYFTWDDPFHKCQWILIISHTNFSKAIWQQIAKLGITTIELKNQVTKTNFGHILRALYHSSIYHIVKSYNSLLNNKTTDKARNSDNLHQHRDRDLDISREQLESLIQHLREFADRQKTTL